MKKNLFFYLFAVLCTVSLFTFTSCSEDNGEDSPVVLPIDKEIAGGYKGTLDVTVDGQPLAKGLPQKITVEKAGDASIHLYLKNFSFMGIPVGDVELKDCPLTQADKGYTFTGTTTLDVTGLKADVDAKGSIVDGAIKIDMDIDAKLGEQSQKVQVTYQGTKLTGAESSEAKITKFVFDRNVDPIDSLVVVQPTIDEEHKTITFMVADTAKAEYLAKLVPTFEISEKATVSPASGVAQDFSNGNVITYTVVAEDGTVAEYKASVAGSTSVYDFESWSFDSSLYPEDQKIHMVAGWASCNNAVALIKNMGPLGGIFYKGGYPVSPSEEAKEGKFSALLESVDTKGGSIFGSKVPKVTAATIFLGTFNAFAGLQDPMATTSFGVLYTNKPEKVTGFYKYIPGAEYYDAEGKLVEGKIDEGSLAAVLYEVEKEDETLNGGNIYTSDKIVAMAIKNIQEEVTEYTPFELNLEYVKDYDPAKKYKFTVIFSSSADGANYNAAVGSKLWIDEVAIMNFK